MKLLWGSPAGDPHIPFTRPSRDPAERRLAAEARRRRDRIALYRARAAGSRRTSASSLREPERTSRAADARLRAARGR